jgi:hypothetical protein
MRQGFFLFLLVKPCFFILVVAAFFYFFFSNRYFLLLLLHKWKIVYFFNNTEQNASQIKTCVISEKKMCVCFFLIFIILYAYWNLAITTARSFGGYTAQALKYQDKPPEKLGGR